MAASVSGIAVKKTGQLMVAVAGYHNIDNWGSETIKKLLHPLAGIFLVQLVTFLH